MESIITPTVFVDEKTKTRPDVVVLGNLEMWGYRPTFDENWPRTRDGRPAKRPGQMYIDGDKFHFKPFRQTGAKLYSDLLVRDYSKSRSTKSDYQMLIHVPKSMPAWVAERVMRDESEKQIQYLKKNVWNKKSGKEAA